MPATFFYFVEHTFMYVLQITFCHQSFTYATLIGDNKDMLYFLAPCRNHVKHIRQESKGISLLHSSGRSKAPSDVQQAVSRSGMSVRKLSLYTPAGRKAAGEGGGHWAGSISSEFPIQIEAPIALPLALPPYLLRVNLFDPEFHYPGFAAASSATGPT